MAESKYGKYIREPSIRDGLHGQEMVYLGNDVGGAGLSVYWYSIAEPFLMKEPAHTHDHDQFECFLGSNPLNIRDFGAEIEIWLGKEEEKQLINSSSAVYIPKGLVHRAVNFRKIDKPISFINIFLAPEYAKSWEAE